jgi:hypothetical protein
MPDATISYKSFDAAHKRTAHESVVGLKVYVSISLIISDATSGLEFIVLVSNMELMC